MKPVEQTITKPPNGNCFAACVASLLELPLEQVPNYLEPHGVWFENWQKWLSERNLTLYCWTASYTPKGYSVLNAKSPRGDFHHSVVALDGEVVWDPHPDRHMGLGERVEYVVFGILDPSKPIAGESA